MKKSINFLTKLQKQKEKGKIILVLAPMADVTDQVFRYIIAKYSKPDGPSIFWTEFVSADGLASIGRKVLERDLVFSKKEKPILGQIFGSNVKNIEKAIEIVYKNKFDGIDINMGCPDKNIEKQGAGAKLITNPSLAKEIILKSKQKILELNKNNKNRFFSFSIKTRLGWSKVEEYKDWFKYILDCEIDIFTIHLRTRKELSLVPAHWELSKEIVDFIKDYCMEKNLKIPFIILNGDIKDYFGAEEKIKYSNADAIMIGRGIFGTPWLFNTKEYLKRKSLDIKNKKGKENILMRLKILLEHSKLFEKKLLDIKSFHIMKKHFKGYINGWENAANLREELMNAKNYTELKEICNIYIKTL